MRWVDPGWLLPLGALQNRRSLINIWNLCDLLLRLIRHPSARDRTWTASDAKDWWTTDLLHRVGRVMGRRARLSPAPMRVLQFCAGLAGQRGEITRLTGSLVVDVTQTRTDLGWSPSVTVNEALARTAVR